MPNGPVLFCSLASVVVCNTAGGQEGWAHWWLTLHGGPVVLRPVGGNTLFYLAFIKKY